MRLFLLIGLLSFCSTALSEPVEIWDYAFATRTDELVAGHGASIFKVDSGNRASFLYSQDRLKFELAFRISGSTAHGTLTSTKGRNRSTPLQGAVSYETNRGGCVVRIVFHEGVHHVVLERSAPSGC